SAVGTGVMNVDAGTITTGGWNFIGKNEGGVGAKGTLNMSGGTLTNTGRTYVGQEGSTGNLNLAGGTYNNVNNELFIIGENSGSKGTVTVNSSASRLQVGGEMWVGENGGNGTLNLSAGTVSVNNWFALGRGNNSTGVVNLSGTGLLEKGNVEHFIVGSDGTGANGKLNQTGGSFTTSDGSEIRLGARGGSTGTWTISAGTATLGETLVVGDSGTGIFELSGTGVVNGTDMNIARIPENATNSVGTATISGGSLSLSGNVDVQASATG
ncbi:MAG: hypothetical protein V4710_12405, partial [Verrucomicrobiota bacterium]